MAVITWWSKFILARSQKIPYCQYILRYRQSRNRWRPESSLEYPRSTGCFHRWSPDDVIGRCMWWRRSWCHGDGTWRHRVTRGLHSQQLWRHNKHLSADMTHHSCLIELLVFPPIHVNVDDVTRGVARVTWPWNSKNHLAEICTLASSFQFCMIFTARCTLVQSAVLRSHVVCLSVCLSVCLWRWWIVIT